MGGFQTLREKEMHKLIDFYKYLNCTSCRRIGLYCTKHREEVEKLLEEVHEDNS